MTSDDAFKAVDQVARPIRASQRYRTLVWYCIESVPSAATAPLAKPPMNRTFRLTSASAVKLLAQPSGIRLSKPLMLTVRPFAVASTSRGLR